MSEAQERLKRHPSILWGPAGVGVAAFPALQRQLLNRRTCARTRSALALAAAGLTPRHRGNGYVARIPHELPDATFGSVWGDGEALQLQQFGRFPPFQCIRLTWWEVSVRVISAFAFCVMSLTPKG